MQSIRFLALGAAVLGAVACTNISAPGATGSPVPSVAAPSVVLPSLDVPSLPTNLPSVDIPSIDIPSNLPSEIPSLDIPSFDIPSIDIPSFDLPSNLPSVQPGADACALITAAELQTVFGATANVISGETGDCTITPSGELFPVVMRYGVNETIDAAKMVVENGEDLTIAGYRAFYGELMGGILYIEKEGRTLVLQAPLNDELKDTLIQLGEVAISRF